MENSILFIFYIIHGLVFGMFSGFIAEEKNRSTGNWFILGFFFGIVALITVVGVPILSKDNKTEEAKPKIDIEFKD